MKNCLRSFTYIETLYPVCVTLNSKSDYQNESYKYLKIEGFDDSFKLALIDTQPCLLKSVIISIDVCSSLTLYKHALFHL
jgi:hypothetical protein